MAAPIFCLFYDRRWNHLLHGIAVPKPRVSVTIANQSESDRRDTMLRVAINGFRRIGRNVLRAVYESCKRDRIQVVGVNELAKPDAMDHLLQYDTSHGRFGKKISHDQQHIYVHHQNGEYDSIRILHLSEIPLSLA